MNKILSDHRFLDVFKNKVIDVIAPASGTTPEKMAMLQSLSVLPLHIPDALLSNDIAYHANTDESRFQVLKKALWNQSEKTIIWALRGGYGSARIVERLKVLPQPQYKKIVIGFSDTTALLLFLSQQWDWPVVHGSVLTQLLDEKHDPENFMKIADLIAKRVAHQTIDDLIPLNEKARSAFSLSGLLSGGNLTLLENSIGTDWQVQTKEKILCIEEVGEKAYRIDRSLYHLFQAGLLQEVKAIVLGDFLAPDSSEETPIIFALNRFAEEMNTRGIAVYKTNQFGHGNHNVPLAYQAPARIFLQEISRNEQSVHFTLEVTRKDHGA